MIPVRKVFTFTAVTVFVFGLTFGSGASVFAQDLGNNETCLECHADGEWAPPGNTNSLQVHNPAGGFLVEEHGEWTCIECHSYIVDLEHEELADGNEVNCTECHDEIPTKKMPR